MNLTIINLHNVQNMKTMENEVKSLIGKTTEVITENGVKEIFVKDVFVNSKGKCLVEDSEGNTYSEDDINWTYKLSLAGCLMVWLSKYGYVDLEDSFEEGAEKYEEQLKDLFNLLIKQGYIADNENNEK